MRKHLAALAALLLSSLTALAASPEPKSIPYPNSTDSIVVPANSPVHYSGTKDEAGALIFQGRLLLTGTFYYGDNDFNDSGDDNPSRYKFEPQAYIIPDKDVAERLPRFSIRNGRQVLFIQNPVAFAKAVVSDAQARRVRCRRCGDVTGHIAIWADQFSAGIECDAPSYGVRFLSVYKPARHAMKPRPDRGC